MQNKTPIVVLTGLGIVAAAAVAGLTRDQWMRQKPEVVASATQPATPAPAEPAAGATQPATGQQPSATAETTQPATTAPATQPAADQTAAATAPAQPAAEQPKAATGQQTATAQPQPAQPAAGNATAQPKVPAFDTVRVEKTGEAVIAGTARAGDDVVVKLDGKVIGQTTANGDGAFVLVPEAPLPAGSGALTLEAKGKGDAAATPSQQSVAVIVPAADQPQEALVAVISPDQPTRVLQKPVVKSQTAAAQPAASGASQTAEKPAKLVSIDAVDYDPAGNIVFSGQGDAGNTARVYIDNNFIGDAQVGSDGHWSFSATAQVKPGVHTLRVDGLDSGGKVVNRVEVPFVREEQKKVAEATQQQTETSQPAQPDTASKTNAETTGQASQQPAATQPEAQQPAASAARPQAGRVVIQPGNNLWTIARVLYGTGAKFTTIYEANKDQIRNPNLIYPGQIFHTPDVAPKAESVDPKRRDPLKPEENAASGQ